MKIFIILISLLFVSAKDPMKQSVLLDKIEKSNIRLESEMIYWFYEGFDENTLKQMTVKQKLTYSNFDTDLLRIRYTYDDVYRYIFFFNYVEGKCQYGVQNRAQHKMISMCRESIFSCLKGKGKDMGDFDETTKCYNKSDFCVGKKPMKSTTEIDKRFCEIVYGRKL